MKLRPMVLPWEVFSKAHVTAWPSDAVPLSSLEPAGGIGVWLRVPVTKDFDFDTLVDVLAERNRIATFNANFLPCYMRSNGRARRVECAIKVHNPDGPVPKLWWLVPIIGRSNCKRFAVPEQR